MSEVDLTALTTRGAALVGTVLKQKWRLDEVLGIGGMATVFAATHRNQKRVAIKMLHPVHSLDPRVRERFLREGYTANAVGHRGAVSVDDDDVAEDGSAFLVMELLQGEAIDNRFARLGNRMPIEEVLGIADQLLDVLVAAHTKGIIHRDIKPDNLFLTQDGVLKVLDFGIAQLMSATGETCIGAIMGTPAFMAPEQARARWELVDGQTDLWSVGATIFTLLTGQFIHEAQTLNEQLGLAMWADARSVSTVLPELPKPLVSFLDRATAYHKHARFPDAATMQNDLRWAWQEISTPSARSSLHFTDRFDQHFPSIEKEESGRLAVFVDLEQSLEAPARGAEAARSTALVPSPAPSAAMVVHRAEDEFDPEELLWKPRRPRWAVVGTTIAMTLAAAAAVIAIPKSRTAVGRMAEHVVAFVSDEPSHRPAAPPRAPDLSSFSTPPPPPGDPGPIAVAPAPAPKPNPPQNATPVTARATPARRPSPIHAAPGARLKPAATANAAPPTAPAPSSSGSTLDPRENLERSLLGPAAAQPVESEE